VPATDDRAGVGPITAMRFVATLDDVTRFATAHDVQSYWA
jgi:transposase